MTWCDGLAVDVEGQPEDPTAVGTGGAGPAGGAADDVVLAPGAAG